MLDENLPSESNVSNLPHHASFILLTIPSNLAFYLRSSKDGVKHNALVSLSHYGSDALPEYSLRHPDPSLPGSKNRYAVALYDIYNPDILFGEVLLIPEWTQPNPSQEQIRLNGGLPPPPQPVLPTEFTIQLYNPDQQTIVKWHAGGWGSTGYWEFEMPQQSFRRPSASVLDRTQSDPTASETTPKLGFKWKKDGKLSKDYVCTLSGKSTNPDGSKRRNREPDITIALFRHFKEITIYEPNLSRVEMEDLKGLEIVILLGAIVIREVFSTNIREAFNITETPIRRSSAEQNSTTNSLSRPSNPDLPPRRHRHSSLPTDPAPPPSSTRPPPPTDPRSQREHAHETARLRKAVEAEQRDRQRAEDAETKRVKRMLEEEKRKAREKQKEIDRETERLKRVYGKEERQSLQQLGHNNRPTPQQPPRPQAHQNLPVTSYPPAPLQRPHTASIPYASSPYVASNLRPPPLPSSSSSSPSGPYLHPPGITSSSSYLGPSASSSTFFGNAGGRTNGRPSAAVPKKSFWNLRGGAADGDVGKLTKQRSTVF